MKSHLRSLIHQCGKKLLRYCGEFQGKHSLLPCTPFIKNSTSNAPKIWREIGDKSTANLKTFGKIPTKSHHFTRFLQIKREFQKEKNGKPLRCLFLVTRLKKIVTYVPIPLESYGASMDCKMHGFQF